MVVSWACEVTEILTQGSIEEDFCVRITVTSQAQLATKYQIYTWLFLLYKHFKQILFFLCMCLYCLILYFNCEMKLSVLLL